MALQIESNARAPGLSRSQLAAIRNSLEPRYDDVLLLVSELVSNSVRHSDTEEIDVMVKSDDGHIRVEVTDAGPGFSASTPRGDGLGLSIVDKVADKWGLLAGDRFTVWAELERI